jgi:RimJ/RimL family protein N-acetyltransferase
MKNPIDPNLVSVRDGTESDIPLFLDYWYRSPSGFIEGLGVDLAKMPSEPDMEKSLRERILSNATLPASQLQLQVITYEGRAIGVHSVNELKAGDSAIFHAHIFKPEMRGRGIGMKSYPLACRVFMGRFHLKKILFKTPVQNRASLHVKEKLGIRRIGEELIGFGVVREGTRACVFELTREELKRFF